MNVLHWHMTDAESFPLELKKRPDLAAKGAWAPGYTYSAADVADVVEYAKNRGVRVVVEIDNPGHTYSWGKGFPQIVALCEKLVQSSNTYPEINSVPLDITNPLTAQVVADVLTETASMFPDDYIHLGGDEINFQCLEELPNILQWMQTHLNSTNYEDLIAYHLNQSVPNVFAQGKKAIFWQEVFTMVLNNPAYNLPIKAENTVVQVWFGGPQYYQLLQKAISMGFETLMSYGWYLDQQLPSIDGATHYLFQDTWMDFYAVDPMTGLDNATEAEKRLVLGGEASQWGETAHPYAIDENVWPRAAATAEKLWSPQAATQNSNEAYHRFIRHQCRLVQRGVRASSFRPNFCPSPLLDAEIPNAQGTVLIRSSVCLPFCLSLTRLHCSPQHRRSSHLGPRCWSPCHRFVWYHDYWILPEKPCCSPLSATGVKYQRNKTHCLQHFWFHKACDINSKLYLSSALSFCYCAFLFRSDGGRCPSSLRLRKQCNIPSSQHLRCIVSFNYIFWCLLVIRPSRRHLCQNGARPQSRSK
jgi:hypothetical protein